MSRTCPWCGFEIRVTRNDGGPAFARIGLVIAEWLHWEVVHKNRPK
jgi:uncharacterized protein (DUF983 family)